MQIFYMEFFSDFLKDVIFEMVVSLDISVMTLHQMGQTLEM